MKAISLFAGAGIGESRLSEIGVKVVLANELISSRAELYRRLNPDSKIIVGDVMQDEIGLSLLESSPSNPDLLIATPPCQGVSVAGSNRLPSQQLNDERNYLLFPILNLIRETKPKNVLIENVPQYLSLLLPHQGTLRKVEEILRLEFGDTYAIESAIINTADLGIPQSRKRAFIKMWKKNKTWHWPSTSRRHIPLEEVIGELPSLEAGEDSGVPWHFARNHSAEHILWMSHTPTGQSAFENDKYFPQREDGTPIKAYNTTYRRMHWDRPAPAITMRNDAISSQMNVHPGRRQRNGKYSDARVLTPRELLIVSSMNLEQWENIRTSEILVRRVLGEGVPPLAINEIIRPLMESL